MANNMQGGMFGSISDLYRKHLNRDPDQAGLDYWTQQANSGAVTLEDIQRNFQGVAAAGTDPLKAQGVPSQTYAANDPALIDRARNIGGQISATNAGYGSELNNQYRFALDDAIYGTNPTGVAPAFGEAITSIYQNELGRLPDQEGLDYWGNQFSSGNQTLEQIQANIDRSAEGAGRGNMYHDRTMFSGNEWAPYAMAGRGLAQSGLPYLQGGGAPAQLPGLPPSGTPQAQPQQPNQPQQSSLQQPDPVRPVRYDLDFTGLGDPNIQRQRVEDAIYARMNPQLDRGRAALETRLANQGITQGSEAYRTAIDENNRAANDARIAAILSGGQEQSRLFGLGLNQAQFQNQGQNQEFSQGLANAQLNNATSAQAFNQALADAQFQNQANQTAISQALMERQIPLNEIIALMSGSQVQQPNFVSTAQTPVQGTDISGNIYANYQGAMNQYNQQVASRNAMLGGLFGTAGTLGAAYLMSDRRLKKNIVKLRHIGHGIFLYAYHYIWGGPRHVGVMADEVKRIMPEAVIRIGDYDAVNYSMVFGRL